MAQNGFVVVPAGFEQFDDAYSGFNENNFVTTDAMLHSLHYVFDNLLTDLEKDLLFDQTRDMAIAVYQTLRAQSAALHGTALEEPNHAAETYMAVAVGLLAPEQVAGVVESGIARSAPIIDQIMAASEQDAISFLPTTPRTSANTGRAVTTPVIRSWKPTFAA